MPIEVPGMHRRDFIKVLLPRHHLIYCGNNRHRHAATGSMATKNEAYGVAAQGRTVTAPNPPHALTLPSQNRSPAAPPRPPRAQPQQAESPARSSRKRRVTKVKETLIDSRQIAIFRVQSK